MLTTSRTVNSKSSINSNTNVENVLGPTWHYVRYLIPGYDCTTCLCIARSARQMKGSHRYTLSGTLCTLVYGSYLFHSCSNSLFFCEYYAYFITSLRLFPSWDYLVVVPPVFLLGCYRSVFTSYRHRQLDDSDELNSVALFLYSVVHITRKPA